MTMVGPNRLASPKNSALCSCETRPEMDNCGTMKFCLDPEVPPGVNR